MIPPLAFIAVRTPTDAPLDAAEIAEVAVLRAEPFGAAVTDSFVAKVRCVRHASDADEAEQEALWLVEVMNRIRDMTSGCVLVGFDAMATRSLLETVCHTWDLIPLDLSPVSLDLRSLVFPALLEVGMPGFGLGDVCKALRVLPKDGSVLEEVRTLAELYRLIRGPNHSALSLCGLNDDERYIVRVATRRLQEGRRVYGPWRVDDDPRKYPREALLEVVDALHYCAAQLRKMDRTDDGEEPQELAS